MTRQRNHQPKVSRFTWPGLVLAVLLTIGVATLTLKAVDILSLVAAATSSFARTPVTLFLTPYDVKDLTVGDTKQLEVEVSAREPINAVGATLKFPQDLIEIVGFSKSHSFFNLWTEETAIHEDDGEIHFSGGTTNSGGMIGTGTILTLTVRAKKSGPASIYFEETLVYAADGKGTLLNNDARAVTFSVREAPQILQNSATPVQQAFAPVATISQPSKPQTPTADVNTDGSINLVDVSIMLMRLVMPYDYHFDLNMDGTVNVADLSIVLSKVH